MGAGAAQGDVPTLVAAKGRTRRVVIATRADGVLDPADLGPKITTASAGPREWKDAGECAARGTDRLPARNVSREAYRHPRAGSFETGSRAVRDDWSCCRGNPMTSVRVGLAGDSFLPSDAQLPELSWDAVARCVRWPCKVMQAGCSVATRLLGCSYFSGLRGHAGTPSDGTIAVGRGQGHPMPPGAEGGDVAAASGDGDGSKGDTRDAEGLGSPQGLPRGGAGF